MSTAVAQQQAIMRAARAAGIDPAVALAIAQRESNFSTTARASKTIRGMFQMRGDLRQQYGVGDSDDPDTQARGWTKFFRDTKSQMASRLGRAPTDAEAYLGHHFGAGRAARMMRMDPSTPVDQLFTPNEMALNPHFAKAGTVGNLDGSIINDIGRRASKFGGADLPDFASFGTLADGSSSEPPQDATPPQGVDLSSFGTLAEQGPQPSVQPPPSGGAPDFSKFGTLVT